MAITSQRDYFILICLVSECCAAGMNLFLVNINFNGANKGENMRCR